jgi:anti-anti-sigma factor
MAELEGEAGANVIVEAHTDQAGATVVSLSGELDSANADALDASLAPLTRERSLQVIFDLSGLRFMDSAGIAVLLGVAARVSAVRLRNPSPAVRRVIELTGLSGVLSIES